MKFVSLANSNMSQCLHMYTVNETLLACICYAASIPPSRLSTSHHKTHIVLCLLLHIVISSSRSQDVHRIKGVAPHALILLSGQLVKTHCVNVCNAETSTLMPGVA